MKRHLFKVIMFTLITFLLVNLSLSFAEDKKVKSSNSNKQEEDIQPPEGEKWYEEGDEKVYKFEINPVTPKEGITGGILIYYGHFIEPPYKVNIVNYEPGQYKLEVNGMAVYPGNEVIGRRFTSALAEKAGKVLPQSITEKIEYETKYIDPIRKIIDLKWNLIIKKYNYKTKKGQEKIKNDIRKYLENHPSIDDFKIIDWNSFEYHMPDSPLHDGWYGIYYRPEDLWSKDKWDKVVKPMWEGQKRLWIQMLNREQIILIGPNVSNTISINNFSEMVNKCFTSSNIKLMRIKCIYKYIHDIHLTKFIYFNFEETFFNNYFRRNRDEK